MADPITDWVNSNANILYNLATNLITLQQLAEGLAYILGILFFIKAIFSLKAFGEGRAMMSTHASLKEPLLFIVVGTAFLFLPSTVAVTLATTFGSSSILEYAPLNTSNPTLNALFGGGAVAGRSLTIIIQLIGLVAFIRGWILIARTSSHGQPGNMGKGLVHVFGGILALNIVLTLQIINNTLYGTS